MPLETYNYSDTETEDNSLSLDENPDLTDEEFVDELFENEKQPEKGILDYIESIPYLPEIAGGALTAALTKLSISCYSYFNPTITKAIADGTASTWEVLNNTNLAFPKATILVAGVVGALYTYFKRKYKQENPNY